MFINVRKGDFMFYHVIIETSEKQKDKFITHYEFDIKDRDYVKENFAKPFIKGGEFQINGYFISKEKIRRFKIKESQITTELMVKQAYDQLSPGILVIFTPEKLIEGDKYSKDITKDVFSEIQKDNHVQIGMKKMKPTTSNRKIFIVHGRDALLKTETARFLEKLNFEAIILHEKASASKTIIEKIEAYSDVGFGIVLYTPCDEGKLVGAKDCKPRARQNVVFEHGFLIGKLGRSKVVALVKDDVETPNDISGVIYISVDSGKAWQLSIAKELKASGFDIDLNAVL
jgi:predicted nucleotide-binding protein